MGSGACEMCGQPLLGDNDRCDDCESGANALTAMLSTAIDPAAMRSLRRAHSAQPVPGPETADEYEGRGRPRDYCTTCHPPPKSKRGVKITDDEVLMWWEAYDNGLSTEKIAARVGRPQRTIEKHLTELGVFEPRQRGRPKRRDASDPPADFLLRVAEGDLTEREQAIADALARINEFNLPGDTERRVVKYARSMEHVKPGARGPVVQSARQRRLDRMGYGFRNVIRRDLKRAGLLT